MRRRSELSPITINGDLRRGGWLATGSVSGDTDAVNQGLNLIFRGKSLAEFSDTSFRQVVNFHALADPDFSFDRYSSQAPFQMGTADRFLSGEDVQDISFAVVSSPSNSHEATSWRLSEMVEHILEKHCNITEIATLDIDHSESTQFTTVGFYYKVDFSNNLWRTLQGIGGGVEGGGEFFEIYCNRNNEIIYRQAGPFQSPKPTSKGTLTKDHIRGTIQVRRNNSQPGEKVGQVNIAAIADFNTVYVSERPTNPGNGKIFKKREGIFAESQARTNTLANRLYLWLTRPYTLTVEVDPGLILFGDDGQGLDLGDRLLIDYDGVSEDVNTGHGVHLALDNQSFFVYGADVRLNPARKSGQGFLTLEYDPV